MEYDIYIPRRGCGTCGTSHCPLTISVQRGFKYKTWCCASIILCHSETKSAVDNIANTWMAGYKITHFSTVWYNKYEYLQYDVFPLEQ